MGLWAAIPAIASVASSIFGKKSGGGGEIVKATPQMTDYQIAGGDALQKFLDQYIGKFVPGEAYGGQFTAGMTPQEQTSLDMLTKYLGSPGTGDLFNAGKSQIMDTLAGKYADPNQSPFIQAMTTQSKTNLTDLINQLNAQRGGRGNFYTTQTGQQQADATRRVAENLDTIIGNFINTERGRQFEAAPIAATLDEYINQTVPVRGIEAAQKYGSLSRVLEQGDLEKKYQEFVRQRGEMALPLTTAGTLYGGKANFDLPGVQMSEQPNSLQNILNAVGGLNWGSLNNNTGNIWSKLGGLFSK